MSDNIKIFQLASYVKPEPIENRNKNWVLNGQKNSFYQYIIDMNDDSSTNGSVNKSYSDYIFGKGLTYTNGVQGLPDWVKLKTILNEKELRKICTDFQVFTEASMEIIKTKGGGLSSISHLPKQYVVPSLENEDGEIESYWYSRNWANTNKVAPEQIESFGNSKDVKQIHCIKPYSVGTQYFTTLDYQGGLVYAEMEREIANQNISYIKNSLSAGYIVNIPDGKSLTDEEKDRLEKKIKQKLTGSSNAGSFVLNFQGRDAGAITVDVFPVPENIHKQYDSFDERAIQKILTAHRCTSPSIVGIISSSGFSNTAEEMEQARLDLMKYIIKPKQKQITNAIEEILVQYGINLDLEFIPLTAPKETPTELKSHVCMSGDDGASEEMADTLISFGQDSGDEWQLLCGSEVDYKTDDDLYGLIQFATSTGTARPLAKSEQDSKDIKILYRYVGNPLPERLFCKKMMLANKLYRKEDILQMNKSGVNDGFGAGGSNSYSIWEWKGGGLRSAAYPNGTCKHKWNREIYLRKGSGLDPRSPLAETISTSEARRRGYFVPTNDSDVSIAPHSNK